MTAPDPAVDVLDQRPAPTVAYPTMHDALDGAGVYEDEHKKGRCNRCGVIWLWTGRPVGHVPRKECTLCGEPLRACTRNANPKSWRWWASRKRYAQWQAEREAER